MTFGQTLTVLLQAAGITRGQLAAHLGYDISYISRWASGIKLPSVKNNEGLFRRIADFALRSSGEAAQTEIVTALDLSAHTDGQQLADAIVQRLEEAYGEARPDTAKIKGKPLPEANCMLSHLTFSLEENNQLIMQSIAKAGRLEGVSALEFFIMPQIRDFGLNEAKNYLSNIARELPENKSIHVRLVADMANKQYCFAICRDICVLLSGLQDRITVDLYAKEGSSDDYAAFLCKDAICVISYYDVLLRGYNSIMTEDMQLISRYYGSGETYLRGKTPLFSNDSLENLYSQKFFQSFSMANDNLRSLHPSMPMIFLDSPTAAALAARHGIPAEIIRLQSFLEKNAVTWSVMLYKVAVVEFLFSGTLNVFGHMITLTQEERREYLNCLLQKQEESCFSFTILSDVTPLLSREDINSTLYLGSRSMFFLPPQREGHRTMVSCSDDAEPVASFNDFWQEFNDLAPAYIMQGESAAAFLRQGLKLL